MFFFLAFHEGDIGQFIPHLHFVKITFMGEMQIKVVL